MCLKTITKKLDANDLVKIGYKVFNKNTYDSVVEYRSTCFDSRTARRMGEKYDAVAREEKIGRVNALMTDKGKIYDVGFHIWVEIADAQADCLLFNDVVVEVTAWDIRAYGTNDVETQRSGPPGKCFVARHIRLMKEVDKEQA